jgi:hypothetical protein
MSFRWTVLFVVTRKLFQCQIHTSFKGLCAVAGGGTAVSPHTFRFPNLQWTGIWYIFLFFFCDTTLYGFLTSSADHARPICPITSFVQLFTSNTLISSLHPFLGCPLDLFPTGLHSKIHLTILYSYILRKWPHHFNFWAFMNLTMSAPPINLPN